MKRRYVVSVCLVFIAVVFISFKDSGKSDYDNNYHSTLHQFVSAQDSLLQLINRPGSTISKPQLRSAINDARIAMKKADFWMRYLQPQAYRLINGPLPVEWETEVFEKFEKPYRRTGAGLTLAALYLDEDQVDKDSLAALIRSSLAATAVYTDDSITAELQTYHHFYLCNRLFLLNLAAIYTTGFECPDKQRIIPELRLMLSGTGDIYKSFNSSFPATPLPADYLALYDRLVAFTAVQPADPNAFDHFTFIKDYVNPLFIINQRLISQYQVVSHSLVDYSLNKKAVSIFDKNLYNGQNQKGIFLRVKDSAALAEIEQVGHLLFFDPILSGNNMRSCASCHKPGEYLADTAFSTSLHYNGTDRLARNTPSLVNAVYNHLVMQDGKHFTLQHQTREVIANPAEMGCSEEEVLRKVLSCKEYKKMFNALLQYTPQEKEVTYDHIVSAITCYYSKFSSYTAPLDDAMNNKAALPAAARSGFNIFMGKAQCATCHFVPQFNGVKPPYIGSEFEVLGVPADTAFSRLSPDEGRYMINPAAETRNAFRTGSLRNAAHTAPYMHNGVFRSLGEVIDFYNNGGGAGRGLHINNQTLSADSLQLTAAEKSDLLTFLESLNENISFDTPPASMPRSSVNALNSRKPGGTY